MNITRYRQGVYTTAKIIAEGNPQFSISHTCKGVEASIRMGDSLLKDRESYTIWLSGIEIERIHAAYLAYRKHKGLPPATASPATRGDCLAQ